MVRESQEKKNDTFQPLNGKKRAGARNTDQANHLADQKSGIPPWLACPGEWTPGLPQNPRNGPLVSGNRGYPTPAERNGPLLLNFDCHAHLACDVKKSLRSPASMARIPWMGKALVENEPTDGRPKRTRKICMGISLLEAFRISASNLRTNLRVFF